MSSYQNRVKEVKELKKEVLNKGSEFTALKHLMLAMVRGQAQRSADLLKHFENNHSIPECELAEIRNFIKSLNI